MTTPSLRRSSASSTSSWSAPTATALALLVWLLV
jgi:hypothetical protein